MRVPAVCCYLGRPRSSRSERRRLREAHLSRVLGRSVSALEAWGDGSSDRSARVPSQSELDEEVRRAGVPDSDRGDGDGEATHFSCFLCSKTFWKCRFR